MAKITYLDHILLLMIYSSLTITVVFGSPRVGFATLLNPTIRL